MTVFCLVELDSGAVADVSLRALTFARGLGPVAAVACASPSDVPVTDLAAYGVTDVYAVAIDCYAPRAWAWVIANLVPGVFSGVSAAPFPRGDDPPVDPPAGPTVVLAAGTDHGNEVLAHLGAITDSPMAANCVSAALSDSTLQLTRQRWAGLLLEDVVLDLERSLVSLGAPIALLTVATDAVSPEAAEVPTDVTMHVVTPSLTAAHLFQ